MGEVLYRKYRSRSWPEVVGQDHIISTLKRAIASNHISHAYLFTGPRGVGKTSVARILAYAVNGIPYDDTATHLDIVEIDAASNRRIDEIRELREKVRVAPTTAKYKVYIIDEVHMLTKEAFNALLKTLEEPPAHVIFILATTEAHKLPMTIVSRTQRFMFRPIEVESITAHLRTIAEREKVTVSDDALTIIAQHSDGSLRDSISLLDQIRGYKKVIEVDDVLTLLGDVPSEVISSLAIAVAGKDQIAVVNDLTAMFESGYEPARIAKQLGEKLRQAVLDQNKTVDETTILELLRELITVPASIDPKTSLEIALLHASSGGAVTAKQPSIKAEVLKAAPKSPPEPERTPKVAPAMVDEPVVAPKKNTETLKDQAAPTSQQSIDVASIWPQVLDAVRKKYNTLYGILRMAQPDSQPGAIVLRFAFKFHKDRINETKNREIIADIVKNISGEGLAVICEVSDDLKVSPPPAEPAADTEPVVSESLQNITSIFGGGELLES